MQGKTKIPVALLACLLVLAGVAGAAHAADGVNDHFTLFGSVTLGGQSVRTEDTVDKGKLLEYRDLTSGLLSGLDLTGRSRSYYLDFHGENFGRTDQFADLRGGSYGAFKYQLTTDRLQHFFTTGAKTPYTGAGTANQTAVLPNLDPSTWNTYDLAYTRHNDNAMFELSLHSPWYVRAEAGEIRFDGNKLLSEAQGTGSGNGFVDLAAPVDYKTRNYSLETGYSTRLVHFALAFLDSKFENDNPILHWTNGYFGNSNPPATSTKLGTDTTYLPQDNSLTRWSLNGLVKQLPWGSSLAVRYTRSESKSDFTLGTSQLIGTATSFSTTPFNATPAVFNGDIKYDTWGLNWAGTATPKVDFRLYGNGFKRTNDSTQVLFSGFTAATTSLGCVGVVGGTGPVGSATGPRICENEPFGFERKNYGAEVAWRPNPANRLSAGYDDLKTDRDFHPDSDSTKERRYSLEWRNTSLDTLVASVKLQRIERRSNFLSPALPSTVWSFDVANLNRNIYKVGLDYSPTPKANLSAEYYYKRSQYEDSPSGRTADDRQEFYVSGAVGNPDRFRVKVYGDFERTTTDGRLVNLSSTNVVNYTVFTGFRDRFEALGMGFDWPVAPRLEVHGVASWNRSKGAVDFNGLAGATALPTTLVDINNYGNNDRLALNLKGTFAVNPRWDLTAGIAYERTTFDDIQFNPYSYILPVTPLTPATQGTASYLSGYYRDPAYKATIAYLLATWKF